MRSVIVTGANGFVGSALIKQLLNKGIQVCAIVNKNTYRLDIIDNLTIIQCSLSELSDLLQKCPKKEYDTFYHFAWEGSAGPERTNYELQLLNAKYTLDAIKIAKELGCSRFVVAGTIMEHETIAATYKPDNKPGLPYIYGAGKTVTHLMAAPYASSLGIDLIWAEITNTYGPGEISPRLVNTTLKKCIKGISPEFTAGTQNYDFVYIDDMARAFYLIGKNGKPFRSYLIGSSNARPLKEFLLEMKNAVAPNIEFKFGDVPFSGVDLPLSQFDTSMTFEDTGFKAKISFGEGCKRTYKWLQKMEDINDSKI
ncbi:dTDP-glucose 4,6-dehydratase RfbB [methanogenic archaeon ISO4-H5]|nr:dTDP-glucose 4,6-dehydratase RfbB [methanogenic archaeon ISO4-H5]